MAREFHLPDIGEGLAEATIVEWYVPVGGTVGLDEPLVQVETDKAVVDLPSPFAGVLLHQGAAAGEVLEVDDLLAVVGEEGEAWEPAPAAAPAPASGAAAAPIVGRLEEAPEVLAVATGRPQALPAVRKVAADLGVDLETVAGTGPGRRITEDDVRAAAAGAGGPVEMVRLSATRRAIAENLARSWREIPHVTTYGAADAAVLLEARKALAATGGPAPLEALLAAALVPVLRDFPEFNATLRGDTLQLKRYYDLGFAVDSPDGLMVAVVEGAGDMDVATLAREIVRVAAAVRERTATPAEMRGQTFTVSNIGAVGGRYGTPIVPYGTTAIASFGRAEPVPVVRDGSVTVATELPISLSYDHRVIDGAKGRAFLAALVGAIEDIELPG
jgi:pyruvate/2-oxoglutarate dehydrogenase complex dihydrolipoamide acyltransferase (E2) component